MSPALDGLRREPGARAVLREDDAWPGLLPTFDFPSAPALNGGAAAWRTRGSGSAATDAWAAQRGLTVERILGRGEYAYHLTLRDLARQETRPVAIWTAAWVEYPT